VSSIGVGKTKLLTLNEGQSRSSIASVAKLRTYHREEPEVDELELLQAPPAGKIHTIAERPATHRN
jgi:hypothetical protein